MDRKIIARYMSSFAGIRRDRLRTMALLCSALFATATQADATSRESWPQVWLNPGIYAHHFDNRKSLRNNNIGFGAEVVLASDHVLMASSFINSNRARSRVAAYQWRPLHWRFSDFDAGAGIAVGAFDGYPNYHDGGWFVAPLPMLSIEGKRLGANISLIPSIANRFDGALAIQIRRKDQGDDQRDHRDQQRA